MRQEQVHTLIETLCREAGDTEATETLIEGWLANHAACCASPFPGEPGRRIDYAARGNPAALVLVRQCMGLPLVR